jgi:Na+/H+ antiporter NhaD/arsenite permease-like protein
MPNLTDVPVEFLIFGATLGAVAIGHRFALGIALTGLVATIGYKLAFSGFASGPGLAGLAAHFGHEWVTLANLMLLLVGFAILAHHFEASNLPHAIPRFLPDGWAGGVCLLAMVFVLSAFLDNIAGAVIGGVVARHVYRDRVGVGFIASIVAAANAGGAGSVVGDTTTTMIWLHGISPLHVLPAYVASFTAFLVFAGFGALAQHRFAPIERHQGPALQVDWSRVGIVAAVLATIIFANVASNLLVPELESVVARRPDWSVAPAAAKGGLFLVSLVAIASMMPVETLPAPSWPTTFGLGLLSSVFDNIPLTALALQQGGYDWALLAYAVGFGGSMIWFGSSAGVALTGLFPEGRSVWRWFRQGWHVPVAYVAGFFVYLAMLGWRPEA